MSDLIIAVTVWLLKYLLSDILQKMFPISLYVVIICMSKKVAFKKREAEGIYHFFPFYLFLYPLNQYLNTDLCQPQLELFGRHSIGKI
jgi:hypothetical protein